MMNSEVDPVRFSSTSEVGYTACPVCTPFEDTHLVVGDSLGENIEEVLQRSQYGIVVARPQFLSGMATKRARCASQA